MRQWASQAVNGRFPNLSWDLWSAKRTLQQASRAQVGPSLRNQWRRRTRSARFLKREGPSRLLLIVPMADHIDIPWGPAEGNYSFELFETACSYMGADNVLALRIDAGLAAADYHRDILNTLHDGNFTHVLGRIDIEANGDAVWHWDLFTKSLRAEWQGVFLPLSYDSAYPYVSMHLDRITRLHSSAMPIVLDRPISKVIRPHRPAAGPLFLPLSDASTATIDAALSGVKADLDLTFIGNVAGYPYRAELLAELANEGLEVTVNPQGRSATDMPGFISYAHALRRSRVTLNFTRCNGVPVTQLKTRMLEGSLFGAVVAADNPLYARDYFDEGQEFISYSSPSNLRTQLVKLLGDERRLQAMRDAARAKADVLRVRNFWEATDRALRQRNFPLLLDGTQ